MICEIELATECRREYNGNQPENRRRTEENRIRTGCQEIFMKNSLEPGKLSAENSRGIVCRIGNCQWKDLEK